MIDFVSRALCPICKAANFQILKQIAFHSPEMQGYLQSYYAGRVSPLAGDYQLCECRACGSLFQKNILNEAGMLALYERWIDPQNSQSKRDETALVQRVGYARQALQVIRALSLAPQDIHVLDFGMGWGHWLLMVRALGMQAYGFELSAERQTHAKSLGLEVLAEIPAASMHMINAEQVFEHLPNPAEVLQQAHTWLKPKGFLRIAVPNGAKIPQNIQARTWKLADMPSIPLEHINIFTPDSLRYFGVKYGFKVIHPPLVLPPLSLTRAEIRQFVGVWGADLAARLRLYQTTVIWLQKQ